MGEKTSTGKIVAAVGGVLLIVSLFLKWAGIDVPDVSGSLGSTANQLGGQTGELLQNQLQDAQKAAEDAASANAFDMFGWIPFLYIVIGVLAIIPAVLDIFDLEVELPFDASLVTLVGGLLALGGMLLVLDSPGSTKIGGWLALVAAIVITVGGLMQTGEEEDGGGGAVAAAPAGYAAPPAPAPTAPPPAAPQPPAAPPQQPPAPPTPPPGA